MNPTVSRTLICGLLFFLTLISGVWVSNSGKPLNVLIFTFHKLIALATVIVIAVNVFYLHKAVDIKPFVDLSVILATALLFLALFISGALLSIGKPLPGFILTIHQVAPLLAMVSSTLTIYLLVSGKS